MALVRHARPAEHRLRIGARTTDMGAHASPATNRTPDRRPEGGAGFVLGARHRRPAHVHAVDGRVVCTLTRRIQSAARCRDCCYLQGTLDGSDACVLCAAPGRAVPRPPRLWGRVRRLIFEQDWPDEGEFDQGV